MHKVQVTIIIIVLSLFKLASKKFKFCYKIVRILFAPYMKRPKKFLSRTKPIVVISVRIQKPMPSDRLLITREVRPPSLKFPPDMMISVRGSMTQVKKQGAVISYGQER